tara:strand:+ start:2801 stop:3004 length:204 start_codon:yes stop_codon:yes gene_type:complete
MGTWILLTLILSILSAGCHTVTVIDGNKVVERLEKGKPFTPRINGYFVPDARMREILQKLEAKAREE